MTIGYSGNSLRDVLLLSATFPHAMRTNLGRRVGNSQYVVRNNTLLIQMCTLRGLVELKYCRSEAQKTPQTPAPSELEDYSSTNGSIRPVLSSN